MSTLVPAAFAVKRTAELLGRLLPSLTHSQSLDWSAELFKFPNWHAAQRSDQLVARPIACSERSYAYDDPLEDHRSEVVERLLKVGPSDSRIWGLLQHLGMGGLASLAPLRKIVDAGDGCDAWRALQYDRVSHFAYPIDPFVWSGSVLPGGFNRITIFPAGSQQWSTELLASTLHDARVGTHGFRLSQEEAAIWTSEVLPRIGRASAYVDGSFIRQTGMFVLIMVRDRKRLDALVPIECNLTAARDSGGVNVVFDVKDPVVSSRSSSSKHLVSCMYNLGLEHFESMSDTFDLLSASDPSCHNTVDVSCTTGGAIAASCASALRAGLIEIRASRQPPSSRVGLAL